MTTGTIILNNLSVGQAGQLLEDQAKHQGKLEINVPAIQESGAGSSPTVGRVQIGWETLEGFEIAMIITRQFMEPTQTAEKSA